MHYIIKIIHHIDNNLFEKPFYILFNIMFKAAGGIEFYF